MDLLVIFLLFFVVILAGFTAWMAKQQLSTHVLWLSVFSGAYLFLFSIIHVIPEVWEMVALQFGVSAITIGGFLLLLALGYGIQLRTEKNLKTRLRKDGGLSFVLFTMHSLFEGFMLAQDSLNHWGFVIGIILHKIPLVFILVNQFVKESTTAKVAIGCIVIFSISAPSGYLLHDLLEVRLKTLNWILPIYAAVCGGFLYLSLDLIKEYKVFNEQKRYYFSALLVGSILALVLHLVHGQH
jgi:zinc transporter ZupT